jgi:hypothetical protein
MSRSGSPSHSRSTGGRRASGDGWHHVPAISGFAIQIPVLVLHALPGFILASAAAFASASLSRKTLLLFRGHDAPENRLILWMIRFIAGLVLVGLVLTL